MAVVATLQPWVLRPLLLDLALHPHATRPVVHPARSAMPFRFASGTSRRVSELLQVCICDPEIPDILCLLRVLHRDAVVWLGSNLHALGVPLGPDMALTFVAGVGDVRSCPDFFNCLGAPSFRWRSSPHCAHPQCWAHGSGDHHQMFMR